MWSRFRVMPALFVLLWGQSHAASAETAPVVELGSVALETREPSRAERALLKKLERVRGAALQPIPRIGEAPAATFRWVHLQDLQRSFTDVRYRPYFSLLGLLPHTCDVDRVEADFTRTPSATIVGDTIVSREGAEHREDLLVHEAVHILQERRGKPEVPRVGDAILAWAATREGEATLVQTMLHPSFPGRRVETMTAEMKATWAAYESLSEMEQPFLRTYAEEIPAAFYTEPGAFWSLTRHFLPHVLGREFVRYGYELGGWPAIDAMWMDPPESTEQILHPEKYFLVRDHPDPATTPRYGWDVGEWHLLTLLATDLPLDEARLAAAGWDSGSVRFWRLLSPRPGFQLRTTWDSDMDAAEFALAFTARTFRRRGLPHLVVESRSTAAFQWDTGTLSVQIDGDAVVVTETQDLPRLDCRPIASCP